MDIDSRKKHWEDIYQNKRTDKVSWFQQKPATSLDFVKQYNLDKSAKIIDVGGGDSFFIDHLIDLGYQDITVLDISKSAIEKVKKRLGNKSEVVKWIVTDVTDFRTDERYDLWHDRAAFHFLTDPTDINKYINTIRSNVKPDGYLVVGTFSEQGPEKCSGIEITQYSEQTMSKLLKGIFKKIKCITIDHKTPFNTIQNFIFCSFRRLETA